MITVKNDRLLDWFYVGQFLNLTPIRWNKIKRSVEGGYLPIVFTKVVKPLNIPHQKFQLLKKIFFEWFDNRLNKNDNQLDKDDNYISLSDLTKLLKNIIMQYIVNHVT